MVNKKSIAVVLVTFNRKQMLLDCLQALMVQTRVIDRIFIINNASTDGTEELLSSHGYLGHPRIAYTAMAENTGGAGGFHEGLRLASQEGFDWYWLLDDDVEPTQDTLNELLQFCNISECIHPLVEYEDGSAHEWEHTFDPVTTYQSGLHNLSFKNDKKWCTMRVACFEGMLVSARVLGEVGLPEKDFFVSGDDGLFGFKAALFTNVIYVKTAKLIKKIKPGNNISPFKLYYELRNRFLLRRKISGLIYIPPYTRYMFAVFLLSATLVHLKSSFSIAHCKAAFFAWKDGLKGITGRKRY